MVVRPLVRPLVRPSGPPGFAGWAGAPRMPATGGGGNALPNIPAWAVDADLAVDYTTGATYGTGSVSGMFPPSTDTHAQTIYAPDTLGFYQPYAANIPVLTNLGLQTVPTRAQLFASPIDFTSGSWSKARTTITADAAVAPDGTLTADKLVEDTATNTHNVAQLETLASGQQVFSISLKAGERFIAIVAMSDASTGDAARRINLLTGAIDDPGLGPGSWTGISMTATQEAGGYWRCQLVATRGAGTLTGARVELCDAAGNRVYTGDGTSGLFLWAGNFFAAPFAGPPILSETTINGNQQVISGLGTQLATGVAGIIQMVPQQAGQDFRRYIRFYNTGGAGDVFMYATNGGMLYWQNSDTTMSLQFALSPAAGVPITIAYCIANNYGMARAVGQAAPSPDVTVTYPASMNVVAIAGAGDSAGQNNYQFTRKLALDFLTPSDDPATKFAYWFNQAVLAAAS